MDNKNYIDTLKVKDLDVKVGFDETSNGYFFEFENKNGDTKTVYCGSKNPDYVEELSTYFGVPVSEISSANDGEDDLNSIGDQLETLKQERDEIDKAIRKLEKKEELASMIQNESLVGKVFYVPGRYRKVVSSYGTEFYSVYCLTLDFMDKIATFYRDLDLNSGVYKFCNFLPSNLIKIEKVDIEDLGTEIADKHIFEKKAMELMSSILEESDTINDTIKKMYTKEWEAGRRGM